MTDQLNNCMPLIIEVAFELVVLPVTGLLLPVAEIITEEIANDFIPDRRIFIFRRIGKPSLGQSPP